MTWYADEIILRATPAALTAVGTSSQLRPFTYHVKILSGHEWYHDEHKHSLPDEGLLVVRPVCGISSHGAEWHDTSILDWSKLDSNPDARDFLSEEVSHVLAGYLDEESMPPASLRQASATLALQLQQPVIYYGCGMWGGDIEYEYCLVYEPTESLFITKQSCPDTDGTNDSLRRGLLKIGLHLPTGYFALHTRGFPWKKHRLQISAPATL